MGNFGVQSLLLEVGTASGEKTHATYKLTVETSPTF
jgi:hypothetical protein